MRAVVTGASGTLGSAVLARGEARFQTSGWHSRGAEPDSPLHAVDVTDADAVDRAFDELAPTVCVHCAAIADVDRCEAEPDLAEAVNVRGTANVAAAAARHGARLILTSSDYVFDGRADAPYPEAAGTNPLQVYGASKRAAEEIALALEDVLVVRLPLLYRVDADFDWFRQTWSSLSRGERVKADVTQVRQPALVEDVAGLVVDLAGMPVTGVLHVAPRRRVTRHQWAGLIAAAVGAAPDLVLPTEPKLDVPRPRNASLAIERLTSVGLEPPRSVDEVIEATSIA